MAEPGRKRFFTLTAVCFTTSGESLRTTFSCSYQQSGPAAHSIQAILAQKNQRWSYNHKSSLRVIQARAPPGISSDRDETYKSPASVPHARYPVDCYSKERQPCNLVVPSPAREPAPRYQCFTRYSLFPPPCRGKASGGGSTSSAAETSTILSSVKGGGGGGDDDGSDMNWFARSKGSRTVPLRTLMLDPQVGRGHRDREGGEGDDSRCYCTTKRIRWMV